MQTLTVIERMFKSSMAPFRRCREVPIDIPRLEFDDGISSMWATLALARLGRAGQAENVIEPVIRTAMASLYSKIAHLPTPRHWDQITITNDDVDKLKTAAMRLINNANANDREKQDFAYLWGIVDEFLEKLSHQATTKPLGELPFAKQLADKFRELTANMVNQLANDINLLLCRIGEISEANIITQVRQEIGACALWIQTDLEDYISQQHSLKVIEDHDPDYLTGASFVIMTQGGEYNAPDALITCIRNGLFRLADTLFTIRREGSHMDEQVLQGCATIFYEELAHFFSLDSPMLAYHQGHSPPAPRATPSIFDERYPLPGSEDTIGEEEELREYELAYDDRAQEDFPEYEPTHYGDDVLTGPVDVEVDVVSRPVPHPKDTICPICREEKTNICTIKGCGHEMCADCLEQQLNSQYSSRYRCALCRADFFPGR
ncbi:hypothetical protein NX059_000875 [Plenodomus lindquistii]|nr:hypothetical protein NX059_000875 [Plenodomus lindquistii]